MTAATVLDSTAEAMLAVAALYVAGNVTLGWSRARKARNAPDPGEREAAKADAETYFQLAGLQQPWVWWLVIVGSTIKLAIAMLDAGRGIADFIGG